MFATIPIQAWCSLSWLHTPSIKPSHCAARTYRQSDFGPPSRPLPHAPRCQIRAPPSAGAPHSVERQPSSAIRVPRLATVQRPPRAAVLVPRGSIARNARCQAEGRPMRADAPQPHSRPPSRRPPPRPSPRHRRRHPRPRRPRPTTQARGHTCPLAQDVDHVPLDGLYGELYERPHNNTFRSRRQGTAGKFHLQT
jgi:hypothetical protein